jgi:hypothetical protein
MNARTSLKLFAIAALLLFGPYAAAQSNPGEWQFTIAPYMVAAGMNGSIAVAGSEVEVDVPFSTILDNLELGVAIRF